MIENLAGSVQKTPEITIDSNGLITATAGSKEATKQLSYSDDIDFIPSSIVSGKTIFGVAGSHQCKTEQPNISIGSDGVIQVIYGGYSTKRYLSSGYDADFIPANIKSGVEIFGVTGTYEGSGSTTIEAPTITVSSGGLITATAGDKSATKQLTTITRKEYTPGTTNQIIQTGRYLTGNQVILGDTDLIPENIKSGVEIFGVTGTYEGSGSTTTTTPTISVNSDGLITATAGSKEATKQLSTSDDSDFVAANIVSGKTIFGVTGTYEGATGTVPTPTITISNGGLIIATAGDKSATAQLSSSYDADFVAANIASGKTIFGVTGTYEGATGVPIDISSAAGMDAVLVEANVGKAYRFTGTTDSTYTNGDIYVVEAV